MVAERGQMIFYIGRISINLYFWLQPGITYLPCEYTVLQRLQPGRRLLFAPGLRRVVQRLEGSKHILQGGRTFHASSETKGNVDRFILTCTKFTVIAHKSAHIWESAHPTKFKISTFYSSLNQFHKSAHPLAIERPWADLREITVL